MAALRPSTWIRSTSWRCTGRSWRAAPRPSARPTSRCPEPMPPPVEAPRAARPARAWQRMLSGRRLNLLDPTPMDVEIGDIAHGLAFVARWNGQTHGDWAYSVAEHSLLVEEIFARDNPQAAPGWRLAALLHDAPEYVIGDMISPVKSAL